MKRTATVLSLLLAASTFSHAEDAPWVQLFNGKDLTGWTPKIRGFKAGDNYKNTFRVEDGVLKVDYSEYAEWGDHYGHLFYKEKFSNYRLRVEYRFVGEQLKGGAGWALRNSGIMIHSESPETMELDQEFPSSIEVQLLGGTGQGTRPTGNLCTPGTNVVMNGELKLDHCFNSTSETYNGETWVTMEVEVHGNKLVKHIVNGKEVIHYTQPQLDERDAHSVELIKLASGEKQLSEGYICLQSESHPVEFRKVEIQKLDE